MMNEREKQVLSAMETQLITLSKQVEYVRRDLDKLCRNTNALQKRHKEGLELMAACLQKLNNDFAALEGGSVSANAKSAESAGNSFPVTPLVERSPDPRGRGPSRRMSL